MTSNPGGKQPATRGRYEFYDRLRAEFPSQLIVDTTELCNLACVHCPHPQFKQSEHYAGRRLERELVEKLIDEIRDHGLPHVQYVRFTGEGEPLIHPAIFELLEYSSKHSGTAVTLTTNGTLLDSKRIEKLIACDISLVDISIDAFKPETYAQIRVNGDLEVTRSNVLALLAAVREAKSKMKVVVSYVEQPLNQGETDRFESFWKESGADFVVVRRLHSGAGAVGSIATSLSDSTDEPRRPCLYPWERMVLNPRGELVFCPQDWVHGSVVADYRTTTVRETWQSEFYQKLREAHLTNEYANHPFCGQCPDWQQTRWPDDGRSYANMVQEFKETE